MVASKVAPAKGSVKDSIDRVLDSYDKNDDGRFDKNEVRAIALELVGERRAASSLRKIVMVLAVALLVAIGVNFASIIIGVELTKESTVDGTTGVLSPSGHKDTAAITGSLAVGVSVQDARRRRLKESRGRALVSVADVGPTCAPTIQPGRHDRVNLYRQHPTRQRRRVHHPSGTRGGGGAGRVRQHDVHCAGQQRG